MMDNGTPLKISSFLPKFKLMINMIHMCYLGLLGSYDEVSTNQQMLLVGLASDREINWERSFIFHLLVDQKVFSRENKLKLRENMCSIILKALKGPKGPVVQLQEYVIAQ